VGGLINLRGQIVTAIDLRCRLGIKQRKEGGCPMNVVVRSEQGATSLLVDRIGEVVTVDAGTFEEAPQNLRGVGQGLFTGTYKLHDRLLLVLDAPRLLAGLLAAA
jgi:purine-binding chemotaxis protein CheW